MNSTELQPPSYSQTSFPIITITVIGIILTVSFLLSYYVFVIKCCLNNRRSNSDIIHRLSRLSRSHKGLHQSAIQAIPILKYFKADSSSHECSVCLFEFEEEEMIRMLPNCFHVFHIDCIDTWLQTHSNCPLCRADVTCRTLPIHNMHDDAVVIDVREEHEEFKKLNYKGSSLGDECIDFRAKGDEEFMVEPIRRSFSMGSLSERRLYATVQEILRHNPHFKGEGSSMG